MKGRNFAKWGSLRYSIGVYCLGTPVFTLLKKNVWICPAMCTCWPGELLQLPLVVKDERVPTWSPAHQVLLAAHVRVGCVQYPAALNKDDTSTLWRIWPWIWNGAFHKLLQYIKQCWRHCSLLFFNTETSNNCIDRSNLFFSVVG